MKCQTTSRAIAAPRIPPRPTHDRPSWRDGTSVSVPLFTFAQSSSISLDSLFSLAYPPPLPLCLHNDEVSTILVTINKFHILVAVLTVASVLFKTRAVRLHLRPAPTADCAALPPDWTSDTKIYCQALPSHPPSTPHIPYVSKP